MTVSRHVARDGSVKWRVQLPSGGRRKSYGIFDTEEAAQRREAAILATMSDDEKGVSLAVYGERWMLRRELDPNLRSADRDRARWRRHVAGSALARMTLGRIRREHVVRFVRELAATRRVHAVTRGQRGARQTTVTEHAQALSRQSVVHVLHLVQWCLGAAADEGLVPANPALGVSAPRDPGRTEQPWTWLRPHEIERIAALPVAGVRRAHDGSEAGRLTAKQRSIVLVALYTGLRGSELWGLRWRDVLLAGDRPELVVSRSGRGPTKSGKVRRVPLLPAARAELEAWRRLAPGVGDRLVWPAGDRAPHRSRYDAGWDEVLDLSRIRAVRCAQPPPGERTLPRFHDLRHTCASHLVQGTWTSRPMRLEEVRDWLGHSSITVTQRYAHLAPGGLHAAITGEARPEDLSGVELERELARLEKRIGELRDTARKKGRR